MMTDAFLTAGLMGAVVIFLLVLAFLIWYIVAVFCALLQASLAAFQPKSDQKYDKTEVENNEKP